MENAPEPRNLPITNPASSATPKGSVTLRSNPVESMLETHSALLKRHADEIERLKAEIAKLKG